MMRPAPRLRTRRAQGSDRGAIAVIVAILMPVLILATAISFDIGNQVDTATSMQAVADTMALDLAKSLDGTTAGGLFATFPSEIGAAAGRVDPGLLATTSLTQSSPNPVTLQVRVWNHAQAPTQPSLACNSQATEPVSPAACFDMKLDPATMKATVANPTGDPSVDGQPTAVPDTVQVTANTSTDFVFVASSDGSPRHAVAFRQLPASCLSDPGCTPLTANTPISGFTIGSYVAAFDTSQSPFLNALLGQGLGLGNGSLQLVSYQGLAASSITLNDLLTANAAAGTPDSLLNTAVSPSTLLGYYYNALAATPGADPQGTATASLKTIGQTSSTTSVTLCKLIQLSAADTCDPANPSAAASTELNSLDFVRLVAEAANGSSALTFAGGVGLGLITVNGNLISPVAVAPPGPAPDPNGHYPTATDTQGNVTVSVNTGLVSINLNVTAATATGTLTKIACGPTDAKTTTTIGVSSTAAAITPTISVTLLGLKVPVTAGQVQTGGGASTLTFTGPFNAQNTQAFGSTEPAIAITPSGSLLGAVGALLDPVLGLLNPLVSPLLAALGVNLGGGTVANNVLSCGQPQLVG